MTEVNVRLTGFSRIDFSRSSIRKALRLEINQVRDAARAMVAGSSPSSAGEFPGKRTGTLRRAIKAKVLRGGFAAVTRPEKTPKMGKDYYPAFLLHGVRSGEKVGRLAPGQGIGKNNRRGRGARKSAVAARNATGWRIAPRADYMVEALARRSATATEAIRIALQNAMVPR